VRAPARGPQLGCISLGGHRVVPELGGFVATKKQKAAARKNIKKAARAARAKKTISRLPRKTRTALGKEGAKAAKRKRRSRGGAA
jgi:hypothetical protein